MTDQIETGTKDTAGDAGQQQPGKNDTTAGGQQSSTQDAAGNQNDEVTGLKAAAQAERTKRQEAEAQTTQLQQQMQILQANTQQGQQPVQPQQTTSMFIQAAKHLGYDPDEFLTPEETGHVMDVLLNFVAQNQQDATFTASHSDFDEVVGKVVNGIFQESPHLQRILNTNPGLRQAFKNTGLTPSTKLIAYQMVKNDSAYKASLQETGMTDEQKKALEAEAAIKAANDTVSISTVQGGGNLDRAAHLAAMNDAEFKAEKDKVMDQAV